MGGAASGRPNDAIRHSDRTLQVVGYEKRSPTASDSAIGGRKIRASKIAIEPMPGIPEQTGLRKLYYANQIKYQKGRQWLLWPADVTGGVRTNVGIKVPDFVQFDGPIG